MSKPRTTTGRVAQRLREAVLGTTNPNMANEAARVRADLEYVYMLVAAQATQQGLDPVDFDFDDVRGTDALAAIFLAIGTGSDREIIYVTPEWRRVVISARARARWPKNNLRPPPSPKKPRSSTGDLSLRTSS